MIYRNISFCEFTRADGRMHCERGLSNAYFSFRGVDVRDREQYFSSISIAGATYLLGVINLLRMLRCLFWLVLEMRLCRVTFYLDAVCLVLTATCPSEERDSGTATVVGISVTYRDFPLASSPGFLSGQLTCPYLFSQLYIPEGRRH